RHTSSTRDWSADVCSSDLAGVLQHTHAAAGHAAVYSLRGRGAYLRPELGPLRWQVRDVLPDPHDVRATAGRLLLGAAHVLFAPEDRKSTRLNSSHEWISYA